MSEIVRRRLVRRRKLYHWSGRGKIYAWLRAHHAQIKKLKVGEDRPWAELLVDLQADLAGTAAEGSIALNNVLNTWTRVCRDIGDTPPVNRFKNYPSRLPKDWKPVELRTPVAAPGTDLVRTSQTQTSAARRQRTAEEKIAALRRTISGEVTR